MNILKGIGGASRRLSIRLKVKKADAASADSFALEDVQADAVSACLMWVIFISAILLLFLCVGVFVLCFETWAVDSPTGFWIWHARPVQWPHAHS